MPTSAAEQLSNCVLIIDELRRVLQCPPEVGLVAHARSIMEKLPNESVARQLLLNIQEADPVLYERLCASQTAFPFTRLYYIAAGIVTVPYQRHLGTAEQEAVRPEQVPELLRGKSLLSNSTPADSPVEV